MAHNSGSRSGHVGSWRDTLDAAALTFCVGIPIVLGAGLIGGMGGAFATLLVLGTVLFAGLRMSPGILMRLYRACPVPQESGAQVLDLAAKLSERAGLPSQPKIYVVPSMTVTAFSTGTPENSAIALTEGLMRRLTLREIASVLSHEISHIRHNDLGIFTLADVLTRLAQAISYLALGLTAINAYLLLIGDEPMSWIGIVLLYLIPAICSLVQLSMSKAREFEADKRAAVLTGDPLGLASALRRLDCTTGSLWDDLSFPVPARRVPQPSLLRASPPAEDRVSRLLALDRRPDISPLVITEVPMMSLVGWGPGEMRPRYRWPGLWF